MLYQLCNICNIAFFSIKRTRSFLGNASQSFSRSINCVRFSGLWWLRFDTRILNKTRRKNRCLRVLLRSALKPQFPNFNNRMVLKSFIFIAFFKTSNESLARILFCKVFHFDIAIVVANKNRVEKYYNFLSLTQIYSCQSVNLGLRRKKSSCRKSNTFSELHSITQEVSSSTSNNC